MSESKAKRQTGSGEKAHDSARKKDGETSSGTRRRGEELENAILAAAWDELQESGYGLMTMERIAVKAGTNKTAVYRRWPSKARITVAAIGKYIERPKLEAPGTGDLRQDLLSLLQSLARPIEQIGSETIHGLLADYHEDGLITKLAQPKAGNKLETAVRDVLKEAERRGEVEVGKIGPRVLALPGKLLQYELLTTREPIAEETITGMIDEIFLPLVRRS
ncbi:TetR/AcrR family transcriptional regulator [Saccharibacillus sp. CPCC 101409]|uniref:TetR/AcrR family transcriptional regulator n=1 Tax=Saccharibacillus sp. CPCC 101409 TaxID=3058041 RepID=UPI002674075D|nr:TetR/AcrR family transcriptional regulator [Saccharibacillus sp. CPCC 101409]MDO3412367.1 TetR/AcrR family transcriptional regulator [Saccharibacillus sp. CPCC 101409]